MNSTTLQAPRDSALISVDRLLEIRDTGQENLVCLDASVPPVVPGFNALNSANDTGQFAALPGARRFDYDREVCKPGSSLPHMMPSAELFQQKVREIGVNRDSLIVVYDDTGVYASPRAWWMFRAMGHDQVLVLDGGLPAWLEAGGEVSCHLADPTRDGNFVAQPDSGLFCDFELVLGAIEDPSMQVVEARSAGRFRGQEPESRPELRGGHMPNAKNLPVIEVIEQGRLLPVDRLRDLWQPLVDEHQKIITSCGSGITACVLALAAWEAGYRNLAVYDGSWAEWGRPSKLPVVRS